MYRNNRSYRNKLAEKRALESRELQRRVARLERLMYEDNDPYIGQLNDDDFWYKIEESEEAIDNATPTSGPIGDIEHEDKRGGAGAEVFENVICHAIKYKGVMPKEYDQKYINAIIASCVAEPKKGEKSTTGNTKRKIAERVFYNIYDSLKHSEHPALAEADDIHTLNGHQPVTPEWSALGYYDRYGCRPSGVPKTDVISGEFHVSIKEKTSGSQLMSGTICETLATINAAASKISDNLSKQLLEIEDKLNALVKEGQNNTDQYNKLAKQYDELFTEYGDILPVIDHNVNVIDNIISKGGKFKGVINGTSAEAGKEYQRQLEERRKKLQDKLNDLDEIDDDLTDEYGQLEFARKTLQREIIAQIKDSNSKLRYEILREAITGDTKFGKGNAGAANYVLEWDTSGRCSVYDVDAYIKHIENKYSFGFSYKTNSIRVKGRKTGKYRADMALRIAVKGSK